MCYHVISSLDRHISDMTVSDTLWDDYANRQIKNIQRIVKIQEAKNEYSSGLKRLTNGNNFIPKSWGNLFEDEDLKRQKIGEFGHMIKIPCA